MPPYELGGTNFRTKGDAVEYVRDVLRGSALYAAVDDPLIYALLDRHPERERKLDGGVERIEVRPNEWGDRCFTIVRPSGEAVAFSFRECFKPSTDVQNAKAALRVEITDQVKAFRDGSELVCALTGVALTLTPGSPQSAEVDHVPPATFDALAEEWAVMVGGWSAVKHHAVSQRRYLVLDEQRASWQEFHRERVVLRLLSAAAHRNVAAH